MKMFKRGQMGHSPYKWERSLLEYKLHVLSLIKKQIKNDIILCSKNRKIYTYIINIYTRNKEIYAPIYTHIYAHIY